MSIDNNSSCTISDSNVMLYNDEVTDVGITEKIQQWTLNNLDSLQLNVVTDLFQILREEGHSSLLKTAQNLLGIEHHRILQQIRSVKDSWRIFLY